MVEANRAAAASIANPEEEKKSTVAEVKRNDGSLYGLI